MGEGEKLVRALFAVARELQPSVIFIGLCRLTSRLHMPPTYSLVPAQFPHFIFCHVASRWGRQLAVWEEGGGARCLSQTENGVPRWVRRGESRFRLHCACASPAGDSRFVRRTLTSGCFLVSGAVGRRWQGARHGGNKQAAGARWSCVEVRDVTPHSFNPFYSPPIYLCFVFCVFQALCKKSLCCPARWRGTKWSLLVFHHYNCLLLLEV